MACNAMKKFKDVKTLLLQFQLLLKLFFYASTLAENPKIEE